MASSGFSISIISALVDVVTGGSGTSGPPSIGIYRSGPTLEMFLGAAGIEFNLAGGSRVPSVREALLIQNRTEEGQIAIKKLIEQVADPREYLHAREKGDAVVENLNQRLRPENCELRLIGSIYRLLPLGIGSVADALKNAAEKVDFDSVKLDFDRAIEQADQDPEDAVTAACSTVESVFKCLLDEMGEQYPAKQDIGGLARAIEDHLQLSPGRNDIEQDIKQILGGLANVARGIGSLRTHCGDAHGKGKKVRRLDSRIARLAIHAASTSSLFYIETWQRQQKQKESGKTI